MHPRCRASKSVSACVHATSIPQVTRGCPGTRAANRAPSFEIMAFFSSPIQTRLLRVRNLSTFTRCGSPPANYGALMPRRGIPFTSICGTTTLSAPELKLEHQRLATLPSIPRDESGPVFAEPWQAQAFALAVKLSDAGHFTWTEWAATLAAELKAAADRGEPDDGSRYYEHWLSALERLVMAKGLTDSSALHERKEAWADAYRHTPHGKPVELGR